MPAQQVLGSKPELRGDPQEEVESKDCVDLKDVEFGFRTQPHSQRGLLIGPYIVEGIGQPWSQLIAATHTERRENLADK